MTTKTIRYDEAVKFLTCLWNDQHLINNKNLLYVWILDGKTSHHFDNINDLAIFSEGRNDCYVGCSLAPRGIPEKGRLTKAAAVAIPGFWSDLDTGKGSDKPSTKPEILEWVGTLDIEPSLIVDSGNGIQIWFTFENPIVLDWHNRELWQQASKNFGTYLSDVAYRDHGWKWDGVSDHSRVFRIPGTYNAKDKNKLKPVKLLWDICTCELHDEDKFLEQFLNYKSDRSVQHAPTTRKDGEIILDFPIQFGMPWPEKKVEFARMSDDKFYLTWNRDRNDFDAMTSQYAYSIMCKGLLSGWTPREIIGAVVHWYHCHEPNHPKALKPRWLQGTLNSAYLRVHEKHKEDLWDYVEGEDNAAPEQGKTKREQKKAEKKTQVESDKDSDRRGKEVSAAGRDDLWRLTEEEMVSG